MSKLFNRRGQILVPAVFILPSLVLFIYLVFEMAKLSREKIRHQFALDTAVFAEVANYSDLANRLAYINGPFPQRVFCEVLRKLKVDKDNKITAYDLFYDNGAFPRMEGTDASTCDTDPPGGNALWPIRFSETNENKRSGINNPRPDTPSLGLITQGQAEKNIIPYNGLSYPNDKCNKDRGIACPLFFLYAQIYELLGEVAHGQNDVFQKLTSDHVFYKKAYWLNTGQFITEGQRDFKNLSTDFHDLEVLDFCGIQLDPNFTATYNPFVTTCAKNKNALESLGKGSLFQLATINELAESPDLYFVVKEKWSAPSVYFPMDLDSDARTLLGEPLHVRVSVRLAGGKVWPDPTPKYQVKLGP